MYLSEKQVVYLSSPTIDIRDKLIKFSLFNVKNSVRSLKVSGTLFSENVITPDDKIRGHLIEKIFRQNGKLFMNELGMSCGGKNINVEFMHV